MNTTKITMDGNQAAAYVSYAFSETAIIYPITPSSTMAELVDLWSSNGKTNVFGQVPIIRQMQSESGVAGALHGAIACGALATSYTCSQGLLLMLPNLYKIAGENLPTVLHVSARALSTHALSIFGDHQDVMACRQTGVAMLCSASVQECLDLALVAHLATLEGSVPFLHFFDGFRTSHEYNKIDVPSYEDMRSLLDENALYAFQKRALSPDAPIQRGTTQNSDVYFQNKEACNPLYSRLPFIVQDVMDKVGKLTNRAYHVFDYFGHEQAERVVVCMGSSVITAGEVVKKLCKNGEKVGVLAVRLYRPFCVEKFLSALPKSCKRIAVLDRTKEAGSLGEPLYLDVVSALHEGGRTDVLVLGGRYGLGMKEFTPSACFGVFQHLKEKTPKRHFTVGIIDDVSNLSIPPSPFRLDEEYTSCLFYGLGSDGTVGANKNSVQLIGDHTPFYAQAYFEYDSKKSGGVTISHLRFGKQPIHAPYLIEEAQFIACHNPSYVFRFDFLSHLKENGVLLLNCPHTDFDELNAYLPPSFKKTLALKKGKLYVIDATKLAQEVGLKSRTSTVMQTAFFLLHPHVLPFEKACELLKASLEKTFMKKGEAVVQSNRKAVDCTRANVHEIVYPTQWADEEITATVEKKDGYFQSFMSPILSLQGNTLPVSAFAPDGHVPTDTAGLEEKAVPPLLPKWIANRCIQCNLCSLFCPHGCIRPFLFEERANPPENMQVLPANGIPGMRLTIQINPTQCMGCGVCIEVCPAKEKALVFEESEGVALSYQDAWAYALAHQKPQATFKRDTVKGSQFIPPLFAFSYACAGCGETAYIKLLTQLFGERLCIANATGCSSIYGGSAPSCPFGKNGEGKGPAWANSLFEDNAEFAYGMHLAQAVKGNEGTSVWAIGGDGWAYDIGYGGLDHLLSTNANVNILVLDSEVYSNTGGQLSKATPKGATARFCINGKRTKKKNLALMAMSYQTAYVAQVSLGANPSQAIKAFEEANAFDGPSLIIAYSPCIAHGVPMQKSVEEEKLAVECGYWHLFRFSPTKLKDGENPLQIDSHPKSPISTFLQRENRFAILFKENDETRGQVCDELQKESDSLYQFLLHLRNFYERE